MLCAGSFLVTVKRGEYRISDPVEKRRTTPSLPAATTGTVEDARRAANNTIANIITLAATGSQPPDSKMECDIPAIHGSSRGNSSRATSGSPAPSLADTAARGPTGQQGGTTGTACANSDYKNLLTGSIWHWLYKEVHHVRGDHGAEKDQG
jgi:hypothetical protein